MSFFKLASNSSLERIGGQLVLLEETVKSEIDSPAEAIVILPCLTLS